MTTPGASELYISARSVLLDALEALHDHLDALVLVGAQAIYFYTGEADVAIATTTKDSDLLVDPNVLRADPRLEEAMAAAHFHLNLESRQPGEWVSEAGIPVDLLVPEALAGGGRRAARIPPHDRMAARKVEGLEAAIVDNELQRISSLDPERDRRDFEIRVAGPSALLIAKLHKIGEREERGQVSRLENKDAHDVYRLLRAVETGVFVAKIPMLLSDELSAAVTDKALHYLEHLFGASDALGSTMAGEAESGVGSPEQVAAAVSLLARDVLDGL